MTARRTQRVDEATALDLLLKGDYAGLAKLTGFTVDQIERQLDGMDDHYDGLEDDDCSFDLEEDEDEDEDALDWRQGPPR